MTFLLEYTTQTIVVTQTRQHVPLHHVHIVDAPEEILAMPEDVVGFHPAHERMEHDHTLGLVVQFGAEVAPELRTADMLHRLLLWRRLWCAILRN